jgi:hypothetical protein
MGEKVRDRPLLLCVWRTIERLILVKGDISVDQAHRGYDVTVDETGKTWFNPF